MLDGLRLCKCNTIETVWVEADSLLIVQMIQNKCAIRWNIRYIPREINNILPLRFFISYVYREANQGADFLANWGVLMKASAIFSVVASLPHQLKGILTLDRGGLPQLRKK